MSQRVQAWLLANTKSLQFIVNERLAKREGTIGQVFKLFEIGERQMGGHTLPNTLKFANWLKIRGTQAINQRRVVLSRLVNVTTGPLNYGALFCYFFCTIYILNGFRFIRDRDVMKFNMQDQPEFWFARYNLMFPPSFLHNRLSAHFIEINHIYSVEMFKRYQGARKEILADRENCSQEERLTRYAVNPNYVYEPMGADDAAMTRIKSMGQF